MARMGDSGFTPVPSDIEYHARNFWKLYASLKDTHARCLALAGRGFLDRQTYEDERRLLGTFWRLYDTHEFKKALTPDQQLEFVGWFTSGNVELLKAGRGLSGIGVAPFIVLALVVGGVAVSLGVTYLAASELTQFLAELSKQQKALKYREGLLAKVSSGQLTVDQAKSMASESNTAFVSSGGSGILDFIGKNLTMVALVAAVGVVFLVMKR